MHSLDPKPSFEMIEQLLDASSGSVVRDKSNNEYDTRTTADINREIEENLEEGQAASLEPSSYILLGSMHQAAAAAVSTEPILKGTQNNPEASRHHGIDRHSLQFEDASNTVINRTAQSPLNSGGAKSPLETPCTPVKGKETENTHMNSVVNIPKPSGIGLHLNSIVNVLQAGSSAVLHVKSAQHCNFNIRGKISIQTSNSHITDRSKDPSLFSLPDNESECIDDTGPKTRASALVKYDTSLSTAITKSSNNPVDNQSAQGNKSEYTNIETDGISEEFNSNSKNKRKRSFDSSDGCKRCHCRKSKCLKLYCDCFAAGLYCVGSCACQGCYNRPEYELMVIESRRQIESRNPLAFAPKIVKHVVEPSASSYGEDETRLTPSSARHKTGCNCKKSMCLKKYCECYHANVGCSDGCRCEGCKNVHGQKGAYSADKNFLNEEGTTERTDVSFIEMMQSGNGGLCHSELTPRTPAVQFFRKDAPDGHLHHNQCIQSPESSATIVTPNVTTPVSHRNSDNIPMISVAAAEVLDLSSPNRELYYGNAETPDEFSVVHHQTGRTVNLSDVLDTDETANDSGAPSFTGTKHYSSAGSISWLRSPGTPLARSSTSRPLKAVNLDGELSNTILDDTPAILKDSPAPLNAVKSSSPNKKRISPPHASQHELGLRPLKGLTTGRKFILKAVPSSTSNPRR